MANGRVVFCAIPLAPALRLSKQSSWSSLIGCPFEARPRSTRRVPSWARRTDTDKRGDGIRLVRGVAMLQTKFTELLGCTVPLQQAGMGKIASPALAAAVADAGGLGMVSGIGAAPPEYVAKVLDGLRRSTSGAFGANFIVDGVRETGKLDADFLKVLGVAASRPPVVEDFYDEPDPQLLKIPTAAGRLVAL